MGGGVAATGHEEVLDVSRVERSVRDAGASALIDMNAVVALDPETFGVMDVGTPVGKSDDVVMDDLMVVVFLTQNVIAHQPSAFAYTGDIVEPNEFPVQVFLYRCGIMVFGIVPQSDRDAKQLITNPFGVFNRVHHAAIFDPPGMENGPVDIITGIAALAAAGTIEVFRADDIFRASMRSQRLEVG